MSRFSVLAVYLILLYKISDIDSKEVNLGLFQTCVIRGEVAFCKYRVHSGYYRIEGKSISRVIFDRVDSDVTLIITKENVPNIRSIVVKIGSCPHLQTVGINRITVEVAGYKCDVSSKSHSSSLLH